MTRELSLSKGIWSYSSVEVREAALPLKLSGLLEGLIIGCFAICGALSNVSKSSPGAAFISVDVSSELISFVTDSSVG